MYPEIRFGFSQVESHTSVFVVGLCGIMVEGLLMKVKVHGSSLAVRKSLCCPLLDSCLNCSVHDRVATIVGLPQRCKGRCEGVKGNGRVVTLKGICSFRWELYHFAAVASQSCHSLILSTITGNSFSVMMWQPWWTTKKNQLHPYYPLAPCFPFPTSLDHRGGTEFLLCLLLSRWWWQHVQLLQSWIKSKVSGRNSMTWFPGRQAGRQTDRQTDTHTGSKKVLPLFIHRWAIDNHISFITSWFRQVGWGAFRSVSFYKNQSGSQKNLLLPGGDCMVNAECDDHKVHGACKLHGEVYGEEEQQRTSINQVVMICLTVSWMFFLH